MVRFWLHFPPPIDPICRASCKRQPTRFPAGGWSPHRGAGNLSAGWATNSAVEKADLAALVSWEVGKITQEALGEVQEMIDMCDFAVGLSRQLYGLTIASERPQHRLAEQWHPLGPVGVITAFNFPIAVWGWNAMLALVCGDAVVWKPSEKTPLSAMACQAIAARVLADMPDAPQGLLGLAVGNGPELGQALAACEATAADLGDWFRSDGPLRGANRRCSIGSHLA